MLVLFITRFVYMCIVDAVNLLFLLFCCGFVVVGIVFVVAIIILFLVLLPL